jgi:hypothetical protein
VFGFSGTLICPAVLLMPCLLCFGCCLLRMEGSSTKTSRLPLHYTALFCCNICRRIFVLCCRSCREFYEEQFVEFVGPCFQLLASLLQTATEFDTQLQVRACLGCLRPPGQAASCWCSGTCHC